MRMVEGVHNNLASHSGSVIVHYVGKVVEEEKPSHDITAHPELRKANA